MSDAPRLTPLEALRLLEDAPDCVIEDGFEMYLDGPGMCPRSYMAPTATEVDTGREWYVTGEPGDVVDESSEWVELTTHPAPIQAVDSVPGISYATGAIEYEHIRIFRKMMTGNGGTIHELYAPPGYAIDATFPSVEQRDAAALALYELELQLHREWGMMEYFEQTVDTHKVQYDRPNACHLKSSWVREPQVFRKVQGRHWVEISREEMDSLAGNIVRRAT